MPPTPAQPAGPGCHLAHSLFSRRAPIRNHHSMTTVSGEEQKEAWRGPVQPSWILFFLGFTSVARWSTQEDGQQRQGFSSVGSSLGSLVRVPEQPVPPLE